MLPVASLIIALPAAATLLLAYTLDLAPAVVAGLALATLIATTGALHEDGLADTVDGLFGGATAERRLEIMRDSRIGAFGALALALSIFIRGAALSALIDASIMLAAAAVLAGAAISRTAGLLPIVLLPSARTDGLGAGVSFDPTALRIASMLAMLTLILPPFAGASFPRTLLAGLGALVAAYALVPLARKKIGGQTGDIAGASQQMSEIAFYALLSGAALR